MKFRRPDLGREDGQVADVELPSPESSEILGDLAGWWLVAEPGS